MRTDDELKHTFKIRLENEVIHIHIITDIADPDENTRRMEIVKERLFNIFNADPSKKYEVIVEILYFSRGHISSGARRIWIELAKHKQIIKSAIVGQNVFLQVAANFIIGAAGRNDTIHWFNDKNEALKWLGE
ncbi:MAG: hypothetical protein HYT08_00420 [Candidatus Levybacteria bacterium]|nr:hypothetical protein [Candidatus Levybacteria bacterium]